MAVTPLAFQAQQLQWRQLDQRSGEECCCPLVLQPRQQRRRPAFSHWQAERWRIVLPLPLPPCELLATPLSCAHQQPSAVRSSCDEARSWLVSWLRLLLPTGSIAQPLPHVSAELRTSTKLEHHQTHPLNAYAVQQFVLAITSQNSLIFPPASSSCMISSLVVRLLMQFRHDRLAD